MATSEVRISEGDFCPHDTRLKASSVSSRSLNVDLLTARESVVRGMDPDEALQRFLSAGSIGSRVVKQLDVCLHTIAAGECQQYIPQKPAPTV